MKKIVLFISLTLALLLSSCRQLVTTTVTTTSVTTSGVPTPTTTVYTLPRLEYRLFAQFDVFWCDPDYYPVARPGSELANAIADFPAIQANQDEFSAILNYLSLDLKDSYTDDEKLLVYRQHKKLTYGVQMTAIANGYDFSLRVGEGQGWSYDGNITTTGTITITDQVVSFNTCPICLTKGTLIDTPDGPIPVEQLRQGMAVWTLNPAGERVVAPIIETVATPVPQGFMVVTITLEDGRTVSASAGHPSADMKALGDYKVGDVLDGARVVAVEREVYDGGSTYDILPASGTGLYWADGILLMSTLQ